MRSRGLALAVVVALGPAIGGCGSRSPSPVTPSSGEVLTRSVTVFAAASLTAAFDDAKAAVTAGNPGLSLTFNFAGSNALAAQITQGAPADVFASADVANMQKLVDAGLVDTPVTFARNKLEIAVAPGNPKSLAVLADLAKPGVSVVLGAPGVPAGDYARQVLSDQHVTVSPRSLETDVKSALSKVTSGEADATLVYLTDVRAAGPQVGGVALPDSAQPAITYPIAVVRSSRNRVAAQAFVDSAVSGAVQRAMVAAGFVPPV